jgi:hypothetical protein
VGDLRSFALAPVTAGAAALAPALRTMRVQLRDWYRTRHYQAIIGWMLSPATG